jgi:hypothetical protein
MFFYANCKRGLAMASAAMLVRSGVVLTTLFASGWTTVEAAPLGRVIMEGRRVGETAWSQIVIPSPGDVVEYRLLVDLAVVGTTNVQGPTLHVITTTANSGFQSLSLQIKQDPAALIQVSFEPPLADPNPLASFRNGWADGTGVSAGTPTPRPGGTGNDLVGIRAVHSPGVFSGADPQQVISGSMFRITRAQASSFAVLNASWGDLSGEMRVNGTVQILITPEEQNGADPLIEFVPLILGIPEPATIVLAAIGIAAFSIVARRMSATAFAR